MTISLNIGKFFNDSSNHALVDELRKELEKEILNSKKKLIFEKNYFYI